MSRLVSFINSLVLRFRPSRLLPKMDERQAARLLELPKLPPSSVDEFDTDIKVVVRTLNNTAASKLLGKDLGQSLFDVCGHDLCIHRLTDEI